MTHHLIASPYENSHGPTVGALFNDKHLLSRGTKSHFSDTTGRTQLLRTQVLEARNDPTIRRNGNQLNLRSTNPSYCRHVVLEQQVVGFIIEAPLTNGEVGTRILQLLNHLRKRLPLVFLQPLEFVNRRDIQLVLGLGLRRLERAGQNGQFRILDFIWHLRMRKVLIHDHTLHKKRVFEGSSNLAVDLDQLEINILPLEIRNRQDSIDSDLGELVM